MFSGTSSTLIYASDGVNIWHWGLILFFTIFFRLTIPSVPALMSINFNFSVLASTLSFYLPSESESV